MGLVSAGSTVGLVFGTVVVSVSGTTCSVPTFSVFAVVTVGALDTAVLRVLGTTVSRDCGEDGAKLTTAGLAAPAESASVSDATGLYGVAYLAVRRIGERFGQDKLLSFFAAVARDGRTAAQASPGVLGVPWTDAAADCDRYIRQAVS